MRSIRIPLEMDRKLVNAAASKNQSVSSLVISNLTKYLEWDGPASDYGYLSIPQDLMVKVLNHMSDDDVANFGREVGPQILKEMLQYWFRRVNTDSFVRYLVLLTKYCGMATFNIDNAEGGVEVTIRHRYGQKGSVFFKNYFGSALKEVLGIDAVCDISPNQVVLRWH